VPPNLSRSERRRTRRPGKSDPGDALAIARVTAREVNLPPIRLSDRTTELGLLLEARQDLVGDPRPEPATRSLTVPPARDGGTVGNLVTAHKRALAGRLLRRNASVQAELARALLARLGRLGREVDGLTGRIGSDVAGHPLMTLPGAGPITVARLIAEVGDVRRFRTVDALAA